MDMAKTSIKQKVEIKASPHDVYEALMDSEKHSEFTGDEAVISRKVGGKFTTFGGYAEGKNIELVPDKRIVQTWRANDWMRGDLSTITIILKPTKTGTSLEFIQTDVPEKFADEISQGWNDFYWKPMKKMLEK
jgi:activator of HSP90 ATPase